MFPERGKNYKKIEKYAGVQEDPANEELQRRIEENRKICGGTRRSRK